MKRGVLFLSLVAALPTLWAAPAIAAPAPFRSPTSPILTRALNSIRPMISPAGGGGSLSAISCTKSSACTAVGQNNAGSEAVAERWNSRKWAIEKVPAPRNTEQIDLAGVKCLKATLCFAIGYTQVDGSDNQHPLIERWNGKRWSILKAPAPTGAVSAQLTAISCTSSKSCMAAGYDYNALEESSAMAEQWNGKSWAIKHVPNPAGDQDTGFYGVSCSKANACEADGYGGTASDENLQLIERWNGRSWRSQTVPIPSESAEAYFAGISCLTSTDCTAIGDYEIVSTHNMAEHWNGRSWRIQNTPNPNPSFDELNGVYCTGASACTAVGFDGTLPYYPLAERWNGKSWRVQTTPDPTGSTLTSLSAVDCTSKTACTAVGYGETGSLVHRPLIEHWNGKSWKIQKTPATPS